MKFIKEVLIDLAFLDKGDEDQGYTIIENKLVNYSRWSKKFRLVFRYDNKFYEKFYTTGATEYQEEYPFENDPFEIECKEVFPKEKLVIYYE